MIEDLLTEHLQDIEVILADVHILGGGLADVVYEGSPAAVPLVFDDLNEHGVALGEDVVHRLGELVDRTVLKNQVDYVVLE